MAVIPLVYHPVYSALELPEGHRYPMNKYRLLYEAIQSGYNSEPFIWVTPEKLPQDIIAQVHAPDYITALFSGQLPAAKMRRIGFPWSERLIERTCYSAGGTVMTAALAQQHGLAIHLSGGYHHAHHDFGSGFCLINDLVLAAHQSLKHPDIDTVMIIDSDVHHGDGTASLCRDNRHIITVSFHCEKNFPSRKPPSDYDVPFEKFATDEIFLTTFREVVSMALSHHQPDLIIYDAGVDIHQDDELGHLNISSDAIATRDRWMITRAHRLQIPMACVVGGGYRANHGDLIPHHMHLIDAAYQHACAQQ
ncbi:Acetoin utilization protein AcuC [Vibrio aerogenes CECT 7868]|uniref:Acetoin utilization protein AcuC n=1 Tax=Vibrio aerogenes CECT 7868 TaxID=1216006 RepID=A0A1M5VFJ0_9VIBR|nr:histone deacetylase [Vibrio aerogenes]SHH73918.1 Acetoin utilization protein AcuC [Vibrio aerogenes CECT 7868]